MRAVSRPSSAEATGHRRPASARCRRPRAPLKGGSLTSGLTETRPSLTCPLKELVPLAVHQDSRQRCETGLRGAGGTLGLRAQVRMIMVYVDKLPIVSELRSQMKPDGGVDRGAEKGRSRFPHEGVPVSSSGARGATPPRRLLDGFPFSALS